MAAARVDATLPGSVAVTITEKRPAFVWQTSAARLVGAADGMLIAGVAADQPLPEELAALPFVEDARAMARLTTIGDALEFLRSLPLNATEEKIAGELLREIRSRLSFLGDVGLAYLTLDRTASTLSGGESQRIRLASQMGSELTGVIFHIIEAVRQLRGEADVRQVGFVLSSCDRFGCPPDGLVGEDGVPIEAFPATHPRAWLDA